MRWYHSVITGCLSLCAGCVEATLSNDTPTDGSIASVDGGVTFDAGPVNTVDAGSTVNMDAGSTVTLDAGPVDGGDAGQSARIILVSGAPYYADPSGNIEASDQINRAINESSPGDIISLGAGTYKTSRPIKLLPGRTLTAENGPTGDGTLACDGLTDGGIIEVSSGTRVRDVTLDGKFVCRLGILIPSKTEDVQVVGTKIHSLRATTTQSAYGIQIMSQAGTAATPIMLTGSAIRPLTIQNIHGGANDVIGDSVGANRGIWSYMSHVTIRNCAIDDIGPEEDGDAIHIQAADMSLNTTIENCTITNFEKRGVKIQSNGVIIRNNTISTAKPKAYAGIGIIGNASQNNEVSNNSISTSANSNMTYGIVISGHHQTATGNTINLRGTDTSTDAGTVNALLLGTASYSLIQDNVILDSPNFGITLIDSSNNQLIGNRITLSNPTVPPIRQLGTSSNNTIQ